MDVEVVRGFVAQQKLWLLRERPCQIDPLPFAARERPDVTLGKCRQPGALQARLDDVLVEAPPLCPAG